MSTEYRETEALFRTAERLRKDLHGMPERSGCEYKTAEYLKNVLGEENAAGDRIVDHGKWFYYLHQEEGAAETVGFRADMDAVTGADGSPYHGCGHDGHSAVMAALALWSKNRVFGKNLVFLFQHAEETGVGAKECMPVFEEVHIDRMYAFHNIPGFPEGCILEREDTFACASGGITFSFTGRQSHAAYPELGRNPVYPLGKLIGALPEITEKSGYKGMTLLTPVHLAAGTKAFGVSAGDGEISFTVRAWFDGDLERMKRRLRDAAERFSEEAGTEVSFSECDIFRATEVDRDALDGVHAACRRAGLKERLLPEPMRWSEDFGQFGAGTKICMVGIGAGEDAPGLHTPGYRWNTEVTRTALRLFSELMKQ